MSPSSCTKPGPRATRMSSPSPNYSWATRQLRPASSHDREDEDLTTTVLRGLISPVEGTQPQAPFCTTGEAFSLLKDRTKLFDHLFILKILFFSSIMQIPRWRSVFILKSSLIPTLSSSTTSITKTHCASIHSTPTTCEKWKNKWNADEESLWACDPEHSHGTGKKRQVKSSARHRGKSHVKKMKRKFRRESFSEDSDGCETFFQATFGKRWYTWYFNESSYRGSTFGFDWREHPYWTNHRDKDWDARSETESVNESCSVGSFHDRTILGLPPSGPLRIEDVKDAFRMSALKWHPDKHQGPSQWLKKNSNSALMHTNHYVMLCPQSNHWVAFCNQINTASQGVSPFHSGTIFLEIGEEVNCNQIQLLPSNVEALDFQPLQNGNVAQPANHYLFHQPVIQD
ncbi:hypothetical protein GH714_020571 [Hevea brasiliensis]|uniref:J domain-containing protein n=1 Tax=Hevea brasiliensis TaxID=3981 RepID=A0A6A6K6F0_HEVBR|nr:hypothetical protein GH714_020571 [Hevea brasiliensis]